jgi:phosphate uptake regulator
MRAFDSIDENLKFLVLEVENIVRLTFRLLNDADIALLEKITAREDYVDNLKNIIENDCFSRIHGSPALEEGQINYIRSAHVICVNLERIADFCVNIARQTEFLIEFSILHQSNYSEMVSAIQVSLSRILSVLMSRDLSGALEICRSEDVLDTLYKENFDWLMAKMRAGEYIENLITTLFIFRYLERIGDSLLNIGEALIFSVIGERIKIEQFNSLKDTLDKSGLPTSLNAGNFKAILGSRSGCQIGRVDAGADTEGTTSGIFKEGQKSKIRREKENIDRWGQIRPGLAPAILGYHENGGKASLLCQFLPGRTLDSVILSESETTVERSLALLKETIDDIWKRTRVQGVTPVDYMHQLKSRLDTVCRVHPEFIRMGKRVEALNIPSSEWLIRQCIEIEQAHPAPFAVLNHGDFNTNNILYDMDHQTIHYIDFYRTCEADYVLDASVFLVSNFRVPAFDKRLRWRLNAVIEQFYDFFREFARESGDSTFELRMALALARSFYTSTRFELNRIFSHDMFIRAHYLMERVVDHRGSRIAFQLPRESLFYHS